MARSVFPRGLAIVYLIAFALPLLQVNGLIGSNGILPVNDYLETIDSEYGVSGYMLFPTLAWFNSNDTFLHVLIWAGMLPASALFVGFLPGFGCLCLSAAGLAARKNTFGSRGEPPFRKGNRGRAGVTDSHICKLFPDLWRELVTRYAAY